MKHYRTNRPHYLNPYNSEEPFPSSRYAMYDPNGLLAIGGDLSVPRLLNAYKNGIFPWFNPGEPILWWTPTPRAVLFPNNLHVSRSLRKSLRNRGYSVTADEAFIEVISGCSKARNYTSSTWITNEMKAAYITLHQLGYAHSIECWHDQQLVGGLYGISLGSVFFGESMFSTATDSSKVALVYLTQQLINRNFTLIDCQVGSEHIFSLGAENIERNLFEAHLQRHCKPLDLHRGKWQIDATIAAKWTQ